MDPGRSDPQTFFAAVCAGHDVIVNLIDVGAGFEAHDAIPDIRFGERFVEIYTETGEGRLTVDYGCLHDTEPAAP